MAPGRPGRRLEKLAQNDVKVSLKTSPRNPEKVLFLKQAIQEAVLHAFRKWVAWVVVCGCNKIVLYAWPSRDHRCLAVSASTTVPSATPLCNLLDRIITKEKDGWLLVIRLANGSTTWKRTGEPSKQCQMLLGKTSSARCDAVKNGLKERKETLKSGDWSSKCPQNLESIK